MSIREFGQDEASGTSTKFNCWDIMYSQLYEKFNDEVSDSITHEPYLRRFFYTKQTILDYCKSRFL